MSDTFDPDVKAAFEACDQEQRLDDEDCRRTTQLNAIAERLRSALAAIRCVNVPISFNNPTTAEETATVEAELVAGWKLPLIALGKVLRDEGLANLVNGLRPEGEKARIVAVAIYKAAAVDNAVRVEELLARGWGGGEKLRVRLNEFLRRDLTIEIWQAWVANSELAHGTSKPVSEPEPNPKLDNPFRDLLNFAASASNQTQDPAENHRHRNELRNFGDAAMDVADCTGYAIATVEARIRLLEDKYRAVLDGQQLMLDKDSAEWKQVVELAAGFDAERDNSRPQNTQTVGKLLAELKRREQQGNANTADLDQWPGVTILKALAHSWFRELLTPGSLSQLRFMLCSQLGRSIDQGNHTSLHDAASALWSRRKIPPFHIPAAHDLDAEECLQAQLLVHQTVAPALVDSVAGSPQIPLPIAPDVSNQPVEETEPETADEGEKPATSTTQVAAPEGAADPDPLPETRPELLALVESRLRNLRRDIAAAGERGRGFRIDSTDDELAWLRDQVEGDYLFLPVGPLWAVASGLDLEALPDFEVEPETGAGAVKALNDLAACLRATDARVDRAGDTPTATVPPVVPTNPQPPGAPFPPRGGSVSEQTSANNPFHELEQFAWQKVYTAEQERSCRSNGRPRPMTESGTDFTERERRLGQLRDAAIAAGRGTGFPQPDVVERVERLREACMRVLKWEFPHLWPASLWPPSQPEASRRFRFTDDALQGEVTYGEYLVEQLNLLASAIDAVHQLAVSHTPTNPGAGSQTLAETGRLPRLTVAEANKKALELARQMKKSFFLLSKRQQAAKIGCHLKTWEKTPFFKKAEKTKLHFERRKTQGAVPHSPPVVSLTPNLEAAIGEGKPNEVLNQLIAEQEREIEPSPLEPDPPGSRPERVQTRKRL